MERQIKKRGLGPISIVIVIFLFASLIIFLVLLIKVPGFLNKNNSSDSPLNPPTTDSQKNKTLIDIELENDSIIINQPTDNESFIANNRELCNEFICAIFPREGVRFNTHSINITSKVNDLDKIELFSIYTNSNGETSENLFSSTNQMNCNPSDCNKFPVFSDVKNNLSIKVVAERNGVTKNISFIMGIIDSPALSQYRSYPESELKTYKILIGVSNSYILSKSRSFIEAQASKLVDNINYVFSKNTKIRFEYSGLVSYHSQFEIDSIITENQDTIDKFIFLWLGGDENEMPTYTSFGGQAVGNASYAIMNPLVFEGENPFSVVVLHEIGHTFYLGIILEQYNLKYYDCNPNLPLIDFAYLYDREVNPYDPMGGMYSLTKEESMWSDYNADILNNFIFGNHSFMYEVANPIKSNTFLKVVDGNENPIENVKVSIHCVFYSPRIEGSSAEDCYDPYKRKVDYRPVSFTFKDSYPLEDYTNSQGQVKIPFDRYLSVADGSIPPCNAFSIKAEKNGKVAGTYLDLMEILGPRLRNNSQNEYIKKLKLI